MFAGLLVPTAAALVATVKFCPDWLIVTLEPLLKFTSPVTFVPLLAEMLVTLPGLNVVDDCVDVCCWVSRRYVSIRSMASRVAASRMDWRFGETYSLAIYGSRDSPLASPLATK